MRRLLVILACVAFSSCGQLPFGGGDSGSGAGSGQQTLSARDFRAILSQGLIWCYHPDLAAGTCAGVERIGRLERDGFALNQVFIYRIGDGIMKSESVQTLRIEDNRACASFEQTLATMRFYAAGSDAAVIEGADQLLPEGPSTQLREFLRSERARSGDPDETCFGWIVHGREPWSLQEVEYIGGVAQPEAETEADMILLYPIGTTTLRLVPEG
jgi:hypothetical protein